MADIKNIEIAIITKDNGSIQTIGELRTAVQGLKGDMDELEESSDALNTALGRIARSGKTAADSTEEVTTEARILTTELGELTDDLQVLDTAFKEVARTQEKVAENTDETSILTKLLSDEYNNFLKGFGEVEKGFGSLISLTKTCGIENDFLTSSLDKLKIGLNIAKDLKSVAKGYQTFMGAARTARTAVLALNSALAINPFVMVAALVGILVASFADLKDEFSFVTDAVEELWDGVKELFPSMESIGNVTETVTQFIAGLGTALIRLSTGPLKTIIKLIKGDFKGALGELTNMFDITGNYNDGYSAKAAKNADNRAEAETDAIEEVDQANDESNTNELNRINALSNARANLHRQRTDQMKEEKEVIAESVETQIDLNEELSDSEEQLADDRARYEEALRVAQGFDPNATREEIEALKELEKQNEIARLWEIANSTEESYAARADALDKLHAYENQARDEKLAAEEEQREKELKDEEELVEKRKKLAQDLTKGLVDAFGEQSVVGKTVAISQATIDTFKAANSAYGAMAGIPFVGPALGAAAAAAAIAAGVANVKKITSTETVKGSGSSGSSAISSLASAASAFTGVDIPSFPDLLQPIQETHNNLNGYDEERLNQPQRVYVLESDITTTQSRVNVVENKATH